VVGNPGWFHDRTINLDGKVAPEALRAVPDDGHVLDDVLRSPVGYVGDWAGITGRLAMGERSPGSSGPSS
jgi:hypothetical protein